MSARASDQASRLRAELANAVERETALARIAQRINEHPLDLDGTLLEISEVARNLTDGDGARVWLREGEHFTPTEGAMRDGPAEFVHMRTLVDASNDGPVARCVRERRTVAVDDFLDLATRRDAILAAGIRSTMAAPLGRGEVIAGSLAVVRTEVRPFNSTEMATLEAFAAQAAIAIETARAQQALAEGLERETATAEILRIISQSPGDVERAVAEIGQAARRLCDADHVAIMFSLGGTREPEHWQVWDRIRGLREWSRSAGQAIPTNAVQWVGPIETWEADNPTGASLARADGLTEAALLMVPLWSATGPIGWILVRRSTARAFQPRHVALLEHFANQAVIAIENGRMFTELAARNREVAEALEQQTATAEVLDVISRAPAHLQAALDAVVVKACRLLESDSAIVIRRMPDGFRVRVALAIGGEIANHSRLAAPTPAPVERTADPLSGPQVDATTRMRHGGPDAILEEAPELAKLWRLSGVNSSLVTPLVTATEPFGQLVVSRRSAAPYTASQIRLFETFASQAVIAIENARLFDELQESNAELGASVEREAALARIAQRINEQPLDVDGTLLAIAEAARSLTDSDGARVFLLEGDRLAPGPGALGDIPADYAMTTVSVELSSPIPIASAVRERRTIAVDDFVEMVPDQALRDQAVAKGIRSNMVAPLGRKDSTLGSLSVVRAQVRPFNATEMATLEAFAAQAATAIETARAQRALAERNTALAQGLERETATADILRVISQSPGELERVLAAIGQAAQRLCEADDVLIAFLGHGGDAIAWDHVRGYRALSARMLPDVSELMAGVRMLAGPIESWEQAHPVSARVARADGLSEVAELSVPMLSASGPIGLALVRRYSARAFAPEHVTLLERFADQALIAIENARVFNELQARNLEVAEALERQTATAEVLEVISKAPSDLQTALFEVAGKAARISLSESARIQRDTNGRLDNVAVVRGGVVAPELGTLARPSPALQTVGPDSPAAVLREIRTVMRHGGPAAIEATYPDLAALWRTTGINSAVVTPLITRSGPFGVLIVSRPSPEPYTPSQIAQLETFAAQAVIAIENTRLFDELQDRNRDVTEALQQQTVMADVLEIIAASPSDLDGVLPKLAEAAARLCQADSSVIAHRHRDVVRIWKTGVGKVSIEASNLSADVPGGAAMATNRPVRFAGPIESWAAQYPGSASMARRAGLSAGSALAVPLQSDEGAVGTIVVGRDDAIPFTDRHVAILETFANQALIAIENARLFDELEARNREITEALRREEASSEILRQISEAPEELDTTLQAITDAAWRLTGASLALSLLEGEFRVLRGTSYNADFSPRAELGRPLPLTEVFRRAMRGRQPVLWKRAEASDAGEKQTEWIAMGLAAAAIVPILRGDEVLGFLTIANTTGDAIAPASLMLLQSFANQAAIAIENARLLRELRESNREVNDALEIQRAMAGLLSVIAGSATDARPVLEAILATGARLCAADGGGAMLVKGDELVWSAAYGQVAARLGDGASLLPAFDRRSVSGRAVLERRTVHSVDVTLEADEYPSSAASVAISGAHTILGAPLLKGDQAVGVLAFTRTIPEAFTPQQIALIETFADHAVIAIENARLFNELQAKTQELEIASRHKSEFLANMSHELRTPLNAIIGYTELLQEECADQDQADFLPDLDKIHSSGKHLLTLISGILDLSKVEAGRMTMFLEDFDVASLVRDVESIVRPLVEKNRNVFVIDCAADLGVMHADLVKLRQVLFNLLSNAAKFTESGRITLVVRRHAQPASYSFAIHDTGIGITEEQRGRLFEAFTQAEAHISRQYGGTGLGLALSRQFCLMMGGDIGVTSEAGVGSIFTVTLPAVVCEAEATPPSDPIATQRS